MVRKVGHGQIAEILRATQNLDSSCRLKGMSEGFKSGEKYDHISILRTQKRRLWGKEKEGRVLASGCNCLCVRW